ncbi:SOS response-associated peptidase family protein [Phytoactinopolyspora endophytica]|uniref:SOS response-associated peptidase family protein n=1 Tax=Phytoactinopolyspora endophytica TaxID=1642495 RepID=UPI0013EA06C3|nr:SOS response-associated peptidase family protein [Phytoactinopolyspora endophytica]
MCGRYVVTQSAGDLAEEFGVDRIEVSERLLPDYNVAPTRTSPTVLARPPRDARDAEADPTTSEPDVGVLTGLSDDTPHVVRVYRSAAV